MNISFTDFDVILYWTLISACIFDVKTDFYDVTYIIRWYHFNENAVTFYIWAYRNEAPRTA